MTDFREMIEASIVARSMREGIERLLDNAVCTDHTMEACLSVVRSKTEDERDRLSEALLLEVVGRMQGQWDKAIKALADEGQKKE